MKSILATFLAALAFTVSYSSHVFGREGSAASVRHDPAYTVNLDGTLVGEPYFDDWETTVRRSSDGPIRLRAVIRMAQAGRMDDKIIKQECVVVQAKEFIEFAKKRKQRTHFDLIYEFIVVRMGFNPRMMANCRPIGSDGKVWSEFFREQTLYQKRSAYGENFAYAIDSTGALFYFE